MNSEKEKRYNASVDILRIIAILGVMLIHTTTKTLQAGDLNVEYMQWTLFLNQSSRFAVPMFFLISGFVLEINYSLHTSYLRYLKKRVDRIFIPYIFWSLIYYFFIYPQQPDNLFMALLKGSASYQLYFVPALLIFYLSFPLLHKWYRFISYKWVLLSLGLVQTILLCRSYYFHNLHLFSPLTIILLNFYIFILGIVLSHYQESILILLKRWWLLLSILTLLFSYAIFYEGYYFYLRTGNYLAIYSQWRVSVLLYTLLFSGVVYLIAPYFTKYGKVIKKISSLSFFIFFFHVIVLEFVWSMFSFVISQHVRVWFIHQVWFDGVIFLSITCIAFLLAYLVHKIPKAALLTG